MPPACKTKLFMQFAQRGLRLGLAGIAAPARQRPLRAMGTQAGAAAGEQERGAAARSFSVSVIATAARFSAGPASRRRFAGERRAELCDIPPGGIVECAGHGA